jgi:hypothetical protein
VVDDDVDLLRPGPFVLFLLLVASDRSGFVNCRTAPGLNFEIRGVPAGDGRQAGNLGYGTRTYVVGRW